MYFVALLTLVCVGPAYGQQYFRTGSQETQVLYCTNRDQRLDSERLRQIVAGKQGPRGPPGSVNYTAVNGTIKKYVKEISGRKLFKIKSAIEENASGLKNLTDSVISMGGSDQMQRQVDQLGEEMKTLKAEIKELRRNLNSPIPDRSTWYRARNGNYYKLFHEAVNYTTAKKNCWKHRAGLATAGIRDDAVRSELLPLLKAAGNSDVWVGLNDIQQEDTFYWEDGLRASSIPWDNDQPNSSGGDQDCVETGKQWKWKLNDESCLASVKYLCETAI